MSVIFTAIVFASACIFSLSTSYETMVLSRIVLGAGSEALNVAQMALTNAAFGIEGNPAQTFPSLAVSYSVQLITLRLGVLALFQFLPRLVEAHGWAGTWSIAGFSGVAVLCALGLELWDWLEGTGAWAAARGGAKGGSGDGGGSFAAVPLPSPLPPVHQLDTSEGLPGEEAGRGGCDEDVDVVDVGSPLLLRHRQHQGAVGAAEGATAAAAAAAGTALAGGSDGGGSSEGSDSALVTVGAGPGHSGTARRREGRAAAAAGGTLTAGDGGRGGAGEGASQAGSGSEKAPPSSSSAAAAASLLAYWVAVRQRVCTGPFALSVATMLIFSAATMPFGEYAVDLYSTRYGLDSVAAARVTSYGLVISIVASLPLCVAQLPSVSLPPTCPLLSPSAPTSSTARASSARSWPRASWSRCRASRS